VPQYKRKNVLLTYTQRVSALSIMQQSPEGHSTKSCVHLEDRLKERTEDITVTGHWLAKCIQRTLASMQILVSQKSFVMHKVKPLIVLYGKRVPGNLLIV